MFWFIHKINCFDETDSGSFNYCAFKDLIFTVEIMVLVFYISFYGTCCFYRHYKFYLELRVMLERSDIDNMSIMQASNGRVKRK